MLNEAKRVDNGNRATDDSPPGKKVRTCQKKGPAAGGEDTDRTKGKQGNGPGRMWDNSRVSGRIGMMFVPSLFEDIIHFSIPWAFCSTNLLC